MKKFLFLLILFISLPCFGNEYEDTINKVIQFNEQFQQKQQMQPQNEIQVNDVIFDVNKNKTQDNAVNNKQDLYSAKNYYQEAIKYLQNEKYKDAIDFFNKAIVFGLDNEDTRYNIALAKLGLRDYKGSVDDCKQILAKNPNSKAKEILEIIKQQYIKIGNEQYNNEDYTTAIKLSPNISYLYSNRANAYYNLYRYEDALADNKQAYALDPNQATYQQIKNIEKRFQKSIPIATSEETNKENTSENSYIFFILVLFCIWKFIEYIIKESKQKEYDLKCEQRQKRENNCRKIIENSIPKIVIPYDSDGKPKQPQLHNFSLNEELYNFASNYEQMSIERKMEIDLPINYFGEKGIYYRYFAYNLAINLYNKAIQSYYMNHRDSIASSSVYSGSRTDTPWLHLKDMVFEKYGRKCMNCGAPDNIDVHHKIPLKEGGTNCIENLIPLCRYCHEKLHGYEMNNYNGNTEIDNYYGNNTSNDKKNLIGYKICYAIQNKYKLKIRYKSGKFDNERITERTIHPIEIKLGFECSNNLIQGSGYD